MVEYKVLYILLLLLVITMTVQRKLHFLFSKKQREVKSSSAVKMSDLETDRIDTINNIQETSLVGKAGLTFLVCNNDNYTEGEMHLNSGAKNFETQTNDYCEIEGVATGRIQPDSQYEQLDLGINYEQLVVYEELQILCN